MTSAFEASALFPSVALPTDAAAGILPEDPAETAFELGLWLAGLTVFLSSGGVHMLRGAGEASAAGDRSGECRLIYAALLRCSRLNIRLRGAVAAGRYSALSAADLDDVVLVLREAIILVESVLGAERLDMYEYQAVCRAIGEKLSQPSAAKILSISERTDAAQLPEGFLKLVRQKKGSFSDQADLQDILPRFGRILRALSIVGGMLRRDEPLKQSLILFAGIEEYIRELIRHINNRLSRFPDEGAELFGSLDAASYTAALELKKVYNHELSGLLEIRPAPTVQARIETAYSLLTDSFLQILAGFARMIDPTATPVELFPSFQVKLDRSLILREHLWKVLTIVQTAEKKPESAEIDELRAELADFLQNTMRYLFFKDTETFERFTEEIVATAEKKDLVPILHRFGAYLETLFGQVNMRAVLSDHPFESQS